MKGPPFFLLACFLGFDAVSASSHFTGVAAASQIPSLELSQDCLGSVSPDSIDKKLAEIKTAVATQLELNGGSDTQNFERELQRIFPDPNSQLARAVLSKLMVEQYGRSFNEYKENGPGRFGEQSDLSDEEVLEQGLSFEPELDRRLRELIELRKGFDEKFRAYVDESNDPERRLEQHVETGIVGMINPILGGLKYINDAKKSYHDGFDQELRSDALRMAELANSIARDFAYREDYTHVKSDLLDNLNNLVQPAANAQRELSLAKYNDYLSVLNKSLITLSAVQVRMVFNRGDHKLQQPSHN